MRLLITTQVVDSEDSFLGFFHGWLIELAKHYERIEVICLREGKHSLPAHVHVHSLGKPSEAYASEGEGRRVPSSFTYAVRFLKLAWKLRHTYDAVFVHMNQEYLLIAGWLWKLLGKRMYLWRNHYAGRFLTDLAAAYATKVFCTSRFSYTTKYKKTTLMPIGVDTDLFTQNSSIPRTPHSILFFSRFAPAKKPDVLLEALGALSKEGIQFEASFYGTALPADANYRDRVIACARELSLGENVKFHLGVPHTEAPEIFNRHEIFVNLASSGTYDKTIFEAAACACIVLAASRDFAALVGERFLITDAEDTSAVAEKLREMLALSAGEHDALAAQLRERILKGQSLKALGERLVGEIV